MEKHLAYQIKVNESSKLITEIRTGLGVITKTPTEINNEFKEFYTKLCTSEVSGETKEIDNFFEKLLIPTINEDHKKTLEAPLLLEEILRAIESLQNSKASGPDGYTSEFYKMFAAPLLLEVCNEALQNGSPPNNFLSSLNFSNSQTRQRSVRSIVLQTY